MTNQNRSHFSIIETLLWENGYYFLPELHLARLQKTAGYFSFPCDILLIKKKLDKISKDFLTVEKYKVRFLLNSSGNISIEYDLLIPLSEYPVKTVFYEIRTDKTDPFYKHKTTNRALYNDAHVFAEKNGLFDVIFLNQEEEITEGSISNIIIQKNNVYFTPPLSCGVLPGIYRTYLLETGDLPIKESVLRKEDILSADNIFLVNSVRKMVPAVLS